MAKRKLKRVEIIILVGFVTSSITFIALWLWWKAPNRDIYIPDNYEGWIRISHSVQDAPALPLEDGVQQLVLSDSGLLSTSTKLDVGWRRDKFYWKNSKEEIPTIGEGEEDIIRYVFPSRQFSRFYEDVIKRLPLGKDTSFFDGTKIEKDQSGRISYRPGKKALQYFYVSAQGRPLSFVPPPIEDEDALRSTEDREIKLD
ncbi:MAG: hypothetical protein AAFY71_23460 [Bacteroidota bacterium]